MADPESLADALAGIEQPTWYPCPVCGKDCAAKAGPCFDCDQLELRRQSHLRSLKIARIPEAYRWVTPDHEQLATILRRSVPVVKARCLDLLRSGSPVINISGTTGTGKTCLAVAMMVSRLELGGAFFIPTHELAALAAQHRLGSGEAPAVDRALRAKLLCLDEFRDPGTEPGRALLERVVFARHAAGRKTIVTMPWTREQIEKVYGQGMRRRLFDEATRARLYTLDEEKKRAEELATRDRKDTAA